MTTKRPQSQGTASAGVHHVAKVTSQSNSIFHQIDQQDDLGNDAFIEFVVEQSATGCCIAAQIKSGASYIRNGRFIVPADERHFEYWRSHSLPVCGFVYDPASDAARWVDITLHINEMPAQFTIEVPDENIFDQAHFNAFRDHFLSYRSRFSGLANFGRALADFSHIEDLPRCESGIRCLFSFHRNRIESWYYIISALNNFREHPLLPRVINALSHVPGHGDIFWVPRENTIPDPTTNEAASLLRRLLSRDSIVTLLSAIGKEGGFERGTIGQCVDAIIGLAPNRRASLESIIFETTIREDIRYWALLRQILSEQHRDRSYCIAIAEKASLHFSDEAHQECISGLIQTLRMPDTSV